MSKGPLFSESELNSLRERPRPCVMREHPLWSIDPAVEMALAKVRDEQARMMEDHVKTGVRHGMIITSIIGTLFIILFTIDIYLLLQLRG